MPTLDFKGKQFVYSHHLSVPFRELRVEAKKSLPAKGAKPALDDNLIIHGDLVEHDDNGLCVTAHTQVGDESYVWAN